MLQQYLPFTVLKLECYYYPLKILYSLQQYLPFTVLKPTNTLFSHLILSVATVLTVYGIETYRSCTDATSS